MAASYTVRPVRAHEWREIKALRLAALSDPAAPIAFLESVGDAAGKADEFWQDRARGSALDAGHDARVRQFVALADEGTWVGSATVLVESAGDVDFAGRVVQESGGHVVGVFVASAHRGQGVLTRLLEAATDWMRERGLPGARLHVHADNVRARRAYEKSGFRDTGTRITTHAGIELEMALALSSGDRGSR